MFTTKTEYGLRAMVALAKNNSRQPLSLAQISKQEHISQSYLERLFIKLRADDLVRSSKGASGGYLLSRPAKKINIFEIVEALEGPVAVFYCLAEDQPKTVCSAHSCLTKRVWQQLQKNVVATLRKFTLADLI